MYYKLSNKEKGRFGEEIAAKYLENNGYKILERNFHYSKYSEIDIVAKERDVLVFVEVKMRTTTDFGHPFEAISRKKLENILIFHTRSHEDDNYKKLEREYKELTHEILKHLSEEMRK